MMHVNDAETKKDLSRDTQAMKTSEEPAITIASVSNRIGIARDRFKVPDDFDANNEEVCEMLSEGSLF